MVFTCRAAVAAAVTILRLQPLLCFSALTPTPAPLHEQTAHMVPPFPQALKLEHPDGHISFMLRLNTSRGSIEVEVMQDGQACR